MYEPPSPWFLFMIYQLMRRRGRLPNAAMEGGATVGIQTYVFEMLEVIFLVADPMPTNDLFCVKLIVDIQGNQ